MPVNCVDKLLPVFALNELSTSFHYLLIGC